MSSLQGAWELAAVCVPGSRPSRGRQEGVSNTAPFCAARAGPVFLLCHHHWVLRPFPHTFYSARPSLRQPWSPIIIPVSQEGNRNSERQ